MPFAHFLLVRGFFLIHLWDLVCIRNTYSKLNAVHVTDDFMTFKTDKTTLHKVNRYI